MAHVEIRPNDHGGWHVYVDGVDLAPQIVPEGLAVSIPGRDMRPTVTLTLRAERLELDLPDADVRRLTASGLALDLPPGCH